MIEYSSADNSPVLQKFKHMYLKYQQTSVSTIFHKMDVIEKGEE